MKETNSVESNLILAILNFNSNELIFNELACVKTEWQKILDITIKNGLAGVLYRLITVNNSEKLAPPFFKKRLKEFYLKTYVENINNLHEYQRISSILTDQNINFIPLKGIYFLNSIYKDDVGIRPIGDIDLLILNSNTENARTALIYDSYSDVIPYKGEIDKILKNRHHLNPLKKDRFIVELHMNLFSSLDNFFIDEVELKNYIIDTKLKNSTTLQFSSAFQLVYISLHFLHHFKENSIRLNWLFDIISYIKIKNSKSLWKEVDQIINRNMNFIELKEFFHMLNENFNVQIPNTLLIKGSKLQQEIYEKIVLISNDIWLKEKSKKKLSMAKYKSVNNFSIFVSILISDLFPSKMYLKYRFNQKEKTLSLVLYLKYYIFAFLKLLKLIVCKSRTWVGLR